MCKGKIIERKNNESGKMTHYKLDTGYEVNFKYDENGNCVSRTDSEGNDDFYVYDKQGNIICGPNTKMIESIF